MLRGESVRARALGFELLELKKKIDIVVMVETIEKYLYNM